MISFPNVERVDDSLVVTWRGAPDASVFLSDNPSDAGIDVRAPDSPGVAVLPLPDPTKRYYVHLFAEGDPFVVTAERRLPLEGPSNVRDLGGYPTPAGPTRWGQVYRSDNPGLLTPHDVDLLLQLGIEVSCDFRSDGEVAEHPSVLSDAVGVEYFRYPISASGPDHTSSVEALKRGELRSFSFDDMADAYGRMLDWYSDAVAAVIREVADPTRGPVVFNCSGGKDRTGLTAALLLLMVGVDEGTVLDDYELSARYLPADRLEARYQAFAEMGIERDDVRGMFELKRITLKKTLAAVRERYGSIDSYLRDHMGLTDQDFAGVLAKLVSPVA